jgi:hypothetical protein
VPAIPLGMGSLTNSGTTPFFIVGSTTTINAEAKDESWPGFMGRSWLVRPSTEPPAGDYTLRYGEECERSDGGGYVRHLHTVDLPFSFAAASPLPTSAGSLTVTQAMSNAWPYDGPVTTADGTCEIQRFQYIDVVVVWNLAPELRPFIDAVQGAIAWPGGGWVGGKDYGQIIDTPMARIAVSCYPPFMLGFPGGRGTIALQSHLAGAAQDFPNISAEVQLDCPPPEVLGPCDDGGAIEAGTDAEPRDANAFDGSSDGGGGAVDTGTPIGAEDASADGSGMTVNDGATVLDGATTLDGGSTPLDASAPSTDASSTPPPQETTDPGGEGCSVSQPGDRGVAPAWRWLAGAIVLAGVSLRRRIRGSPLS